MIPPEIVEPAIFSDTYIFKLLDTLKSEYFIVSMAALSIAGVLVKKIGWPWLMEWYNWILKRFGK